MTIVSNLQLREAAELDRDRLDLLVRELGEPGAERVVGRALDDMGRRLFSIEAAYLNDELARVRRGANALQAVADQVGFATLARVSGHVADTATSGDPTSLSATVARLIRVGEASLLSVCDPQDARL
ncbi:MAG: hypothetical protein AAFR35_12820 [Pseudomonadota bacterium]